MACRYARILIYFIFILVLNLCLCNGALALAYDSSITSRSSEGASVIYINNLTHTPEHPAEHEEVTITATVSSYNELSSVRLNYCVNELCMLPVPMTSINECIYTATIGPFEAGTRVTYYIVAEDVEGNSNTSSEIEFTVLSASIDTEPGDKEYNNATTDARSKDDEKEKHIIPAFELPAHLLAVITFCFAKALLRMCNRD